MDGRKRTVQIKFRVTEAERDLILEKMKLVPTRNMAAYLRKIAIDGYIIQIDHADIEFAADNKRLGQVLYALAHSSLRPEFSIEYTVADVEKCKNELLHKAIEDSIQKAQVLTTAANVKLGEIQAIDYSWGEIDFVTKPLNEMRLMECTECEMSAPAAYDIDIEADDIDVTDTVTVVWTIA